MLPSTHSLSLITIRMLLSISLSFYLTHLPKPTRIHTLAPSISLTPSPVNEPSITTFGGFHRRIALETPYAPFSQTLKAPRTSRASLVKGCAQANAAAQQALIAHWQSIVKCIDNYLKIMRANHVPPFLICKLFAQIFSFINVQLFSSLLLWRECCSFSNGEYLKAGLAELEQWCHDATEEFVGLAWDEMKHIQQAVGFLVIHQKP